MDARKLTQKAVICFGFFVSTTFSFMVGRESVLTQQVPREPQVVEQQPEFIGPIIESIEAEVVSIHDGDTITVNIDGWPDIIGKKIEIRFAGIDAPEIHDKRPRIRERAILAREFVYNRIGDAKRVQLKNLHRDKYFRIDAEVFVDGHNLCEELVQHDLAVKYDGKTKKNWE